VQIAQRHHDARRAERIDVEEPIGIGAVDGGAVGMADDRQRLRDVVVAGQRVIFADSGDGGGDGSGEEKGDGVGAAAGEALRIAAAVVVGVDDGLAQRAVIDRRRAGQTVLRTFDFENGGVQRDGGENDREQANERER